MPSKVSTVIATTPLSTTTVRLAATQRLCGLKGSPHGQYAAQFMLLIKNFSKFQTKRKNG